MDARIPSDLKIEVADNFFKRSKGLIGRNGLAVGTGLLIPKCNAIHTFFMRFPIDATFLDADDNIVKVVRDIKPWRFLIWGGWRARKVLETQSASVSDVAGRGAVK